MKILIASPTYDGAVRIEYMKSVMALTDYLSKSGIEWEMLVEPSTLLHVMRSVMASKAMMDGGYTHMLFVDTDMGFPVSAVRKLIAADKEVIGCAYPYRTVPLHEEIPSGPKTFRAAISEVVPYAVRLRAGQKKLDVKGGICEVASIGTGLLLISVVALKKMVAAGAAKTYGCHFPYSQWHKHETYHGFFEHLVVDGQYIGEDYSFCKRWVDDCGGQIYAVIDQEIFHVGPLPVVGRYMDRLRAGKF